jgi:hypothetical protein
MQRSYIWNERYRKYSLVDFIYKSCIEAIERPKDYGLNYAKSRVRDGQPSSFQHTDCRSKTTESVQKN